ncbi:Fimbrillin-like [Prevotella aff. ruminicola Tc2-24]|uniref:Fimbrillin-like n=2 Tax=Prevotella aff. ruminicola Tc2-24 TaxID=81582 RepID=A0A1I0NJK8_9BACT|nr:Fimbrillin-like [Prevotella aff. ruminicola Tc2-24]
MTALTAVTATLISCSSEDSLAGKENPAEGQASGIPFVVNVANSDATRGTAISAISSFNMVGIQGTSNKWMDNYLFTKPDGSWVADGHANLTWPDGTDTHTFYATSDNTSDAPAITNGKFTYTVPANISDQKDLLVSLSEDNESGSPVTLSFKHALSSVKFNIGFDKDALGGDNDSHIKVTKITLYHIATKGTFDFANYATNPWTVDPDDAEYKDIVITLKQPIEFVPSAFADFKELDGNYIDETSIGEIYVMPHKPTAWDTDGTSGHPLNNSYIGVTCQFYEYTGSTYRDMFGLDETSDDGEYEEAKEEYIDTYDGQASTDDDSWLDDKQISVLVPTAEEFNMNVVLESILNKRNEDAAANGTTDNYEEVYIPLVMTNGFGFAKNNVINIRMDQMKYADGRSFYEAFTPIINP